MGNSRVWTGRWKGGRTFNGKDGRPVFVLRKMVQRRAYTVYLDARSETEAEAELARPGGLPDAPGGAATQTGGRRLPHRGHREPLPGVHAQRGHHGPLRGQRGLLPRDVGRSAAAPFDPTEAQPVR